jgi:hypothetical protein
VRKAALEALVDAVQKQSREPWVAELAAARKKFEDENAEFYKVDRATRTPCIPR